MCYLKKKKTGEGNRTNNPVNFVPQFCLNKEIHSKIKYQHA